MTSSRRLLAPFLAIVWAAAANPVAADCDPVGSAEEVLPTAEVAFVGRVIDVQGAVARFEVGDVWAGDVGSSVEVRGVLDHPGGAIGEDDRQWENAETYLVIPFVDGPVLRDHICTATTVWTDELAALRPEDAREIAPEAPQEGVVSIGFIIFAVTAAAVAILGISVLAFRNRSG
jgi:hypothetical protein